MAAQEALKLCPDLRIVQVPVAHGKVLIVWRESREPVYIACSEGHFTHRIPWGLVRHIVIVDMKQTHLHALHD
jgi:hypothetical protein